MATAELAPHGLNATHGRVRDIEVIAPKVINVTVSGAKAPSYWRALAADATDLPARFSPTFAVADMGSFSEAVTFESAVINTTVASLDTAKKIHQEAVPTDGSKKWTRASTNESTWGPWRPVPGTSALTASPALAAIDTNGAVTADALPPGGDVDTNATAGAAITQYVAVYADESAGSMVVKPVANLAATSLGPSQRNCFGIALNAAANGAAVVVRTSGTIYNASWTWTPRGAIYAGTNGVLTQAGSTAMASYMRVGYAISATRMVVRPAPEYTLPNSASDRLTPLIVGDSQPDPRMAGLTDSQELADASHYYPGSLSSAATVEMIDASGGDMYGISGNTNISSLGGAAAKPGIQRVLLFTGNGGQLVHSSNLILPGAANITWAINDVATFRKESATDAWRCIAYMRGATAP